ncbi:MAG: exodeoxyribonuclease III [Sandaracinus sp.]|nr:exodeoxyribonuclease III [Sandaracinus sp.]
MDLVTWNINSVRAREDRLVHWLDHFQPDVLCLQETKVVDEAFPRARCEALGYHVSHYGQKAYNGVAILSRSEPEDVVCGFDDGQPEDEQSRLIGARIDGVRIVSAYFPNGGRMGSDKYAYKLGWMKRLRAMLDARFDPAAPLALCGDYNVAPFPDDVANPDVYEGSVLANDDVRGALADIADFGLVDVFRPFHPRGHVWSWWDYRAGSFQRDEGLRIDHVFCTAPLAERVIGASVDRPEREGTGASDHAPVRVRFAQRAPTSPLWPPQAP